MSRSDLADTLKHVVGDIVVSRIPRVRQQVSAILAELDEASGEP